jgi:hypothetical protein
MLGKSLEAGGHMGGGEARTTISRGDLIVSLGERFASRATARSHTDLEQGIGRASTYNGDFVS